MFPDNYDVRVHEDVTEAATQDIAWLTQATILALDTETTGLDPKLNELRLITIATPDNAYIFFPKAFDLVKPLLQCPNITWLMHYAPFDAGFIYARFDVRLPMFYDTRREEKHLLALRGQHKLSASLGPTVERYLNYELNKKLATSFLDSDAITDAQLAYAAEDALCLFPVALHQGFIRAYSKDYRPDIALMYDYVDGYTPERPDSR